MYAGIPAFISLFSQFESFLSLIPAACRSVQVPHGTIFAIKMHVCAYAIILSYFECQYKMTNNLRHLYLQNANYIPSMRAHNAKMRLNHPFVDGLFVIFCDLL